MAPIRVCCRWRLPLLLTYWSNTWHIFKLWKCNETTIHRQRTLEVKWHFCCRGRYKCPHFFSTAAQFIRQRCEMKNTRSLTWAEPWWMCRSRCAAVVPTTGGTNKQMLIKGTPKQTEPHLTSLLHMRKICILKAMCYIIDDRAVKYIHLHREDFPFPGLKRLIFSEENRFLRENPNLISDIFTPHPLFFFF